MAPKHVMVEGIKDNRVESFKFHTTPFLLIAFTCGESGCELLLQFLNRSRVIAGLFRNLLLNPDSLTLGLIQFPTQFVSAIAEYFACQTQLRICCAKLKYAHNSHGNKHF